jgi:hypothetical protein
VDDNLQASCVGFICVDSMNYTCENLFGLRKA